jgi:hypothetical protein
VSEHPTLVIGDTYTRHATRTVYQIKEITRDNWVVALGEISGKPASFLVPAKDFFYHFDLPQVLN